MEHLPFFQRYGSVQKSRKNTSRHSSHFHLFFIIKEVLSQPATDFLYFRHVKESKSIILLNEGMRPLCIMSFPHYSKHTLCHYVCFKMHVIKIYREDEHVRRCVPRT